MHEMEKLKDHTKTFVLRVLKKGNAWLKTTEKYFEGETL